MNKVPDILAESINEIKSGRASIEDCLAKYPARREELEPLLLLALDLKTSPQTAPSMEFKVQTRVRLIEGIHAQEAATKGGWLRFFGWLFAGNPKRRNAMPAIVVFLILALMAARGGAAYASQDATPGDMLYPVKTGLEQTRLMLTTSEMERARLHLDFASTRLAEAAKVAENGNADAVTDLLQRYNTELAATTSSVDNLGIGSDDAGQGKDLEELRANLEASIGKHLTVLEDYVLPKAPESAKMAIRTAIERSRQGLETAAQAAGRGVGHQRGDTDQTVPPTATPMQEKDRQKGNGREQDRQGQRPESLPPANPPMGEPFRAQPGTAPPFGLPDGVPPMMGQPGNGQPPVGGPHTSLPTATPTVTPSSGQAEMMPGQTPIMGGSGAATPMAPATATPGSVENRSRMR